jgi:ABC-type enterobactin transport system permease subunit
MRPLPMRVPLDNHIKQLRVEHSNSEWRLWLMANGDFTNGTFLQLLDNGSINRVTWHPDGTESVLEIK